MQEIFSESKLEEFLRHATDYAALSIGGIISQLEDDYGTPNKLFYDYVKLMHGLEVHFLFPNLDERDRSLITAVLSARSAVLMGLKKCENPKSADELMELEAVITHLKNRFADLKMQVDQRELGKRLTSLQRTILDREFLSMPRAA